MHKLEEVAGRVEALSGPDREVDAEIVCALDRRPDWLGRSVGHMWIDKSGQFPVVRFADERIGESRGNPSVDEVPAFTTSLDAAMMLVPEGWYLHIEQHSTSWTAELSTGLWFDDTRVSVDANADTPALALCAAALRAIAQKETDNA